MTTNSQQRLTNLFEYFKAIELRQRPRIFTLQEQFWYLLPADGPSHPYYRFDPTRDHEEGVWLSVRKPKLSACPNPPQILSEWLLPNWSEFGVTKIDPIPLISKEDQQGTRLERFEEDGQRVEALAKWLDIRSQWAEAERPNRILDALWNDIFAVYNDLKREAEKFDLMLGSGILSLKNLEVTIYHPVVMRQVTLDYEPVSGEFRFLDKEHNSEFFSSAFSSSAFQYLDVKRWSENILSQNLHPLDTEPLTRFFKAMVGSIGDGIYSDEKTVEVSNLPVILNQPVIFLRRKETGRAEFIDNIIKDIRKTDVFPTSLRGIVGLSNADDSEIVSTPDSTNPNEQANFPLTKPANLEQLEILRKLSNQRDVIVQGPPGTGKTHTIANVIGNLLSQGKSVLVTAHNTKALRVLRDKVAEPLRNLCVSVLENDRESRTQRETAIRELSTRLSHDPEHYEKEAGHLDEKRTETILQIKALRSELHSVVAAEYLPLPIQGTPIQPVDAGKFVVEFENIHNWLPGPIHDSQPIPISNEDVVFIYESGIAISLEDEIEIAGVLPVVQNLMSPSRFAELVTQEEFLTSDPTLNHRTDLWRDKSHPAEDLAIIAEEVVSAANEAKDFAADRWKVSVLDAGSQNSSKAKTWELLISEIETVLLKSTSFAELLFRFRPQLHRASTVEEQHERLAAIETHLKGNKSLGWSSFTTIFKGWRRHIDAWTVLERKPASAEEFGALKVRADLELSRRSLTESWEQMMVPLGEPSLRDNHSPEEYANQYVHEIRTLLTWHSKRWVPLQKKLENCGLNWVQLFSESPKTDVEAHNMARLLHVVSVTLLPVIKSQQLRLTLAAITSTITQQVANLSEIQTKRANKSSVVDSLINATNRRSTGAYEGSHKELRRLTDLYQMFQRRDRLLKILDPLAQQWVLNLRARLTSNEHKHSTFDPSAAWRFRQIIQELDRRTKTQISILLESIRQSTARLEKLTAQFVEASAWYRLLRRVTSEQRQALLGWGATMKKIGAGTGKRVPALIEQARRDMEKARGAVPVWIMPFSSVTSMFDPVRDKFDVLIIDEASQEDVLGIASFYLAKQVIVVGDDEQVTPLDVGGAQAPIDALISTWLTDLPSPMLFDPKTSVYDRALISFGSVVRLREHFRCVPEIIQFSNSLCYNNEIKPLRESSSTPVKPALVPFYVKGQVFNKTNQVEAFQICLLIKACIECPEYKDKTFGVISMVGEAQWKLIDMKLRQLLDPITYENRKILCGNPSQFQGDERDVVFLSLVDARDEVGPLTFRGDGAEGMWKKFFNVAASRARDQLWVVYSLDPQTQLKQGDVRRKLIEHALDPSTLMTSLRKGFHNTESNFEKDVLSILTKHGYEVTPQWEVGAYRIDLVVEGNGQRLAIECDGDTFHDLNVEEDLGRQVLLERLGWKFSRIRASDFYRDSPHKHANALTPVFQMLQNLGIEPSESRIDSESTDAANELIERVKRLAASFEAEASETLMLTTSHSKKPTIFESSSKIPDQESAVEAVLPIDQVINHSGSAKLHQKSDRPIANPLDDQSHEIEILQNSPSQQVLFSLFTAEKTSSEETSFSGKNKMPVRFKINDRVEHEKFGLGTVSAIIGSGESQALQIQFAPLWGTRTIMTKYVRLLE